MINLDAALRYAAIGWHVFPLVGKVPTTTHGHLDATTDPRTITQWWTEQPNASIGIHCRASGLVVVDVDTYKGGVADRFNELESRLGTLKAHAQRSNRGGVHYILEDPSPGNKGWTRTHNTGGLLRGKLGDGIDIKCNGYFIAAPSDGYEWINAPPQFECDGFEPYAKFSPAWLAALRKPPASLTGATIETWHDPSDETLDPRDALALATRLDSLPEREQGRGSTYAAVMSIFHDYGLSLAGGEPFLLAWNKDCGQPYDGPGLVRQLQRIAKKITTNDGKRGYARQTLPLLERLRRSPNPSEAPPTKASEEIMPVMNLHDPSTPWAAHLARAVQELQTYRGSTEDHAGKHGSPAFEPASAVFARAADTIPWLVPGLITRRSVSVISAPPKSDKTWVELELAQALATGTAAFGQFPVDSKHVVAQFLAEDDARAVRNRHRAIAKGRKMSSERATERIYLACRKHLDITNDEDLIWVIASCYALPEIPTLITIDPLRDVHNSDENDSTAMADVMARFRAIRDIVGCSVLFVHHSRKSSQGSSGRRGGEEMRGSSAIHGAYDCALHLRDLETDGCSKWSNKVEVEIKGARGAGIFRLELEVIDDAQGEAIDVIWTVLRENEESKIERERESLEEDDRAVMDAVREFGAHAAWRDIRAGIEGHTKTALDRARLRLLASKRLELYTDHVPDAAGRTYRRERYRLVMQRPGPVFGVLQSPDAT